MATTALVSVSEYLRTSYRPDQEMLEGRLVERNVGDYDHSNLQGALVAWLRQRQREWNIRVLPEQRVRVSASRFRGDFREPAGGVLEAGDTGIRVPLRELIEELE